MRVLFSFFLLFGAAAQAAEFQIDISPARPIVAGAQITMLDGGGATSILMGHWFAMNIYLKNEFSEPLVVDTVEVHVKSAEGKFSSKTLTIDPIELQPGASFNLARQYVDGLPDSASFEYAISVEIRGYRGTLTSVGDKTVFTKFFTTQ